MSQERFEYVCAICQQVVYEQIGKAPNDPLLFHQSVERHRHGQERPEIDIKRVEHESP